jgi:cell division control protein 45
VRGGAELRSVVLLGCGAMLNLSEAFPLPDDVTCYVIDSHRPVDHRNVHCDAQYVVFSDVLLDEEDFPSDDEEDDEEEDEDAREQGREVGLDAGDAGGRGFFEDDSDLDSDSDEDGEQELGSGTSSSSSSSSSSFSSSAANVGTANAPSPGTTGTTAGASTHGGDSPKNKRKRDQNGDDPDGLDGSSGGGSDDGGGDDSGPGADTRLRLERRRERIQKLQTYYAGTKTGTPAAYVAYELANQLGRSGNDLLWYAIIGVTSHHAQGRMDSDMYSGLHMALRDWVNANNTSNGGGVASANVASTLAIDDDGTRIRVPDEGRISVKNQEYRIMLYRHWSVYEAMYHSQYVSTQLSTWVEQGRQRLDTFLAKMGISKRECQQPFSFMSAQSKNKLRNKVADFKSEHGLEDLLYRSFTRTQGYAQETSAADTAHAMLAMIECGSSGVGAGSQKVHVPKHVAEGSAAASSNAAAHAAAGAAADKEYAAVSAERLGENFHRACQVLQANSGSERSFRVGVALAQQVQRAVIRQGVAVIQQRLLTNAGKFRYAYLSNMSDGDLNFFRRPTLLSKLAHWLIAALLSKNRKRMASNDLPLVLCVLDEERQVFICVGTPGPKETRNRFGEAFRKAADTIEVRYKHTGFTSSVIEVEKEHVQNFTDQLYLTLENMDRKRHGSKRARMR